MYSDSITSISALSGLTQLQDLDFDTNNVTDMSPVTNLVALHGLWAYSTQITTIPDLSPLTALVDLDMSDDTTLTSISGVAGATALTNLYLDNCSIIDSELSSFSGLTNLVNLGLDNNGITNLASLVSDSWRGDNRAYLSVINDPLTNPNIWTQITALINAGTNLNYNLVRPVPTYTYSQSLGATTLSNPQFVAVIGSNPVSVYVTDSNNVVYVFNGGNGALITSWVPGNPPEGIGFDPTGKNIYVAENSNGVSSWVNEYTLSGGDPLGGAVSWQVGNTAWVDSLAVDKNGDVDVIDLAGNVVQYSSAGVSITTWGSFGSQSQIVTYNSHAYVMDYTNSQIVMSHLDGSGPATLGVTGSPISGLAMDSFGNFYFPSMTGAYMYNSNAIEATEWSICSASTMGAAIDSAGNFYVVDVAGHQVCVYNPTY